MKNLKYILFFLIVITLVSCSKFGVDFTIENKTNFIIDSLTISNGFNAAHSIKMNINDVKSIYLDFKSNNNKTDGNYYIKYYVKGNTKIKPFGYFSNGIPSESEMNIQIFKDSIIVN